MDHLVSRELPDSDGTSGHSNASAVDSKAMSDLLQYGGPVLWLQAALAFMAVVYIIERLLYFHSVRVNVADFLVGISNHLRQKGLKK